MADGIDPAAVAARLSAAFRAALADGQNIAMMPAGLVEIVSTYLDHAAQMLSAAMGAQRLADRVATLTARNEELERQLAEARRVLKPFKAYAERCRINRWLSGRADEERLLVAYGADPNDVVAVTMKHFRAAARAARGEDRA